MVPTLGRCMEGNLLSWYDLGANAIVAVSDGSYF